MMAPVCTDGTPAGADPTLAVGRRSFLTGGAATVAVTVLTVSQPAPASPRQAPVAVALGLSILPRASWAAGLPAPAALPTEEPGDVRVLLVHHSASANGYAEDAVATHIRQFHALHTGPEKGWPDVAYNFFVDRFGQVWEGRAGSLDGPVIGDATGGNQGFSQLVCLIGNHVSESPSPGAIDALSRVLAWIAVRDGVDVTPGATTSFVSRGSNRWPAGTTVETTTIAGHRDMSQTACPGDAAYARVRGDLPALVSQRASERAAAKATPAPTTTTPEPATTASTTAPASAAPPPTTTTAARAASTDREARPLAAPASDGDDDSRLAVPLVLGGIAALTVALPVALRRRRVAAGPDAAAREAPSPPT
jgi:hypothetical protein